MREQDKSPEQNVDGFDTLSSDESELLCLFAMLDAPRQQALLQELRRLQQETHPEDESE
ncbi:MAG: hypothetical protein ACLUUJ_11305 [Acutalibacteraceae bacterium]|nr:hypothetical protein [Bacillota bacterium]